MTPWIVLGAITIGLILLELFSPSVRLNLAALALGLVALMALFAWPATVPPLFRHNLAAGLSVEVYQELVLLAALGLAAILSQDAAPVSVTLLMLAVLGALVAVSAANWLLLFLGVETVNVALYGLVGHWGQERAADEALLKFFLLGTVFTAFELAGIGLIAGYQGTLSIQDLGPLGPGALITGEALVLAALLFKFGSFPFHLWAPDTYEGTPWPAVTTIATLPKVMAGALIIRLFAAGQFAGLGNPVGVFGAVALATMIVGALGAWRQRGLKRMLAYASISQVGFVLLPLATHRIGAAGAYLVTYVLITLAAFSAAQVLYPNDNPTRWELTGAMGRHWGASAALAVALAAFAGFPFTIGMAGKLYSLEAVLGGTPVLWLTGLVVTGFSFLYYFRWIYPLFAAPIRSEPPPATFGVVAATHISAALVILFGLWALPMMWLVRTLS